MEKVLIAIEEEMADVFEKLSALYRKRAALLKSMEVSSEVRQSVSIIPDEETPPDVPVPMPAVPQPDGDLPVDANGIYSPCEICGRRYCDHTPSERGY